MARREPARLTEPEEVLLLIERESLTCVAGVDEAGRGPLAGPVVAAAVCLPSGADLCGVTDSKLLTAAQREECCARIWGTATAVGIGIVDPCEIDRVNILQATYQAMALALEDTGLEPDLVLVDGRRVPGLARRQIPLVKGDRRSLSIAAASVVAKVTRDRLMVQAHEQYPEYGFDLHKGYGCRRHHEALRRHGPCPLHRRSFAPVRALLPPEGGQRTFEG